MVKFVVVIVAYLISFVTQAQSPKTSADRNYEKNITVKDSLTLTPTLAEEFSHKDAKFVIEIKN
jgi:hypothetical protein